MLNLKNCYILLYFIYTIFGYNIWTQIIKRNKIEYINNEILEFLLKKIYESLINKYFLLKSFHLQCK